MATTPKIEVPLSETEGARTNNLPSPSHRHGAPSAPWPWVDTDDGINVDQFRLMNSGGPSIPKLCTHENCNNCWKGYPQSRYPNWTRSQVEKCKIAGVIGQSQPKQSVCYFLDINHNGHFRNANTFVANTGESEEIWKQMLALNVRTTDTFGHRSLKVMPDKRPSWSRTRSIFIKNLSGPLLQMLGTKYNIEPFFFSSSLNWIPSRFQADLQPGIGDSITITITFLRSIPANEMPACKAVPRPSTGRRPRKHPESTSFEESIDTTAPLKLTYCDRVLCLDLLSVHIIRNIEENTIISYHPDIDTPTTGAEKLHDRIRFAGQSVYWQKMFQQSRDPTLLLLTFIWHTIYSWDQALEHLYNDICLLESRVIDTGKWKMNQDLHIIRAHHLYYTSLLDDIRKSVEFIRKHKNPAMTSDKIPQHEKELNSQFVDFECDNLILEIDRLTDNLAMQQQRLGNVMNLVYCSVSISGSKLMRGMTEMALKDSAAMKQVTYLAMLFLPASFVAGVFGMNIDVINPNSKGTIPYYVALSVPLTLTTIWIIIAFQSHYLFPNKSFVHRLAWPVLLLQRWWNGKSTREARANRVLDRTMRDDYEEIRGPRPNGSWA